MSVSRQPSNILFYSIQEVIQKSQENILVED